MTRCKRPSLSSRPLTFSALLLMEKLILCVPQNFAVVVVVVHKYMYTSASHIVAHNGMLSHCEATENYLKSTPSTPPRAVNTD